MTLSDALAALDATRASILADLDAFAPEQRTFSPSDTDWSVEQVAEHLLTAERGILGSIQRSAGADLGAPSPNAVEGVISFMNSDQKAQTPPFLQPQGMAYEDARDGLGSVGADWHALVATHADSAQGRAVFAHPMAGPMTLLDTLRFVESHAGHHRHQLERIRASDGFPA
ncbi:MAG: DinB family protein [Bacteroidota bacterium]